MVDTSRAKKLSNVLSMAGNVPSPVAPILKGVGYGLKALSIIGDIRNSRENIQKEYYNRIKQIQNEINLKKLKEQKRNVVYVGIAFVGIVGIILLAKSSK